MGCELSKVAVKPPDQASADPLTAKQKYTVMASWRAVSRALEPTGVYMLIRYVYVMTTVFMGFFWGMAA